MFPIQWASRHKRAAAVLVAGGLLLASGLAIRAKRMSSEVFSEPIRRGAIIESVYGIGTVTATRSFQLKFGTTGTIQKLFVKEGDVVKRGDPLVTMDGTLFSAPFDGTVTWLPLKVGENVFAQTVILSLVDLQDRYIVVSLEQQGALRVRNGQKARISFDNMRGEAFNGAVESVYSNGNNFLVRIGVTDLPPQILPGMTADVAIGIDEHPDVLLVPVAAIEEGKVTVKRGRGMLKAVAVKTGIVDGAMAEIVSGDLKEGDRLSLRKKASP